MENCDNCLVLPVCKSKMIIDCNKLYDWANERSGSMSYVTLKKHFPNWQVINQERIEGKLSDSIYRRGDDGEYVVMTWGGE